MKKLASKLTKIFWEILQLITILATAIALFQDWYWVWDTVLILVLAWLWARRIIFKKALTPPNNGDIGSDFERFEEPGVHPAEPRGEGSESIREPIRGAGDHDSPVRGGDDPSPDFESERNDSSDPKNERSFEQDLGTFGSDPE